MSCERRKNRHLPYIEPTIRTIVGFLVTALVVMLYRYDERSGLWLGALLFISLNLFQSGFTRWCMMEKLLKRLGFICELDEIRKLGDQLRESSARQAGYLDTLNLLNEAVLELSPEGEILNFSDGWRRLLGDDARHEQNGRNDLVDYIKPSDVHTVTRMLSRILSEQKRVTRIRFRLATNTEEERWVEGQFMLDRHDEKNVRIKGVLRDITESYQQECRIRRMAMHDTLTGLPNRSLLENRMQQALAHARRHGFQVGVLFIDLDNFKQVNDTQGHKSGDQLLVRVAQVLGQKLRASDTLARWGGDEFVVLLPDLSSGAIKGIRTVADNLMSALEEDLQQHDIDAHVTLSIGAACYPADAETPDALLALADKALYFAKSQGRNNVQIYSEMRENHAGFDKFDITARLGKAVRDKQIQAHYQIIVDAATHRPRAIEALARWHDEAQGWVSPAAFIPMAENMGLIQDLSQQVIEQALRDFGQLQQVRPGLQLALNLSTRQLCSRQFAGRIRDLLDAQGVDPQQVKLEVTESLELLNAGKACKTLEQLREAGFQLSLDDFGTGFSSLSQLHELPFDELKIDMSFVRRAHEEKGRVMLGTIIQMGHAMGYRIVAEGVEEASQAHILHELGADLLQGYRFSRPEPLQACLQTLQHPEPHETLPPATETESLGLVST